MWSVAGRHAAGVEEYQKDVRKFEYQVLVGGDDAKAKFGGTPLPTTYLIDRDGRIRQKIIGARDREGWEAAVKPLLDERGRHREELINHLEESQP